ncbi:MAG: FG-GAP-like repeat-containing protein [Phormidesmis sp. CAN_BIN44]|nr:FG-GAP-like repeat-containing protein [Phormidesmis sp. CAN_BIN44]
MPGIDNISGTRSTSQKAVQLDLTPTGLLSVKIDLNNDGDFLDANETPAALQNYNVVASNGALPSTFKFGFSASTGGSTNVHEITGLNVDTFNSVPYTPLVNFTSTSASVNEGAASLNLTAQIDVATTNTVTVPVTLSGTATNTTDYTLSSNTITILPGQLTGSIALNPIDNLVVGSNKTAVVTMGTPTGAQLSPQNNVFTATIVDNDYSIAASGSSTYTENGSPVLISPTAAITGDLTASAINSATVSIGSGFSSAEDRLGIQGQSGTSGTISSTSITWSYDTTSGILTLSGTDTGANYQAALRQVVYRDLSDAPNTITRAVAYTLNYNSSQQATSSSSPSIAITPVNDAPTVAAPATIAVIARTQTALTGITFADVDAGSGTVTATLTVRAGTLAATSGSGVTVGGTATNLTLSGTLAAINSFIAGNSLTYTTPSTSITTQTLGVSLSDGGNTGTGGTLNSGVTNVTLSTAVSFVKNDFNGDGKSDILWRNPSTGQVAIWEMNGTTLLPSTGYISNTPDLTWQISGTGDFNNDKKADILWRNSSTGQLAIWEMDGTTLLPGTGYISNTPDATWQIARTVNGTGDTNGDGLSDIFWYNTVTNQTAVWEMNGTTLLPGTGYISNTPALSWVIEDSGDYNGDGKTDLLWRNTATNQVAVWELDGTQLQPGTDYVSTIASLDWQVAA